MGAVIQSQTDGCSPVKELVVQALCSSSTSHSLDGQSSKQRNLTPKSRQLTSTMHNAASGRAENYSLRLPQRLRLLFL